ncbi:MAG: glycosyltransferase family 2 protein [Ignavibacteriales bacterium]|nr:glycosyltransferase family 2 protein [Ignavibacteriales bacterium]
MRDTCYVIIPAFNAERTLSPLLKSLSTGSGVCEVIVVDDGSRDGTADVAAAQGARVVRHGQNRGKGAALATGITEALKDRTMGWVVTMDADLQHDPGDLPRFFEAQLKGNAEIFVGWRRRMNTGMPLARMLSNTITSFLVSARTGCEMADSQCGYRLIAREVLERVSIESEGYEAETELLIKAARLGFRIAWVPIRTVYREEPSSMTHWTTTKRFVQTLMREY